MASKAPNANKEFKGLHFDKKFPNVGGKPDLQGNGVPPSVPQVDARVVPKPLSQTNPQNPVGKGPPVTPNPLEAKDSQGGLHPGQLHVGVPDPRQVHAPPQQGQLAPGQMPHQMNPAQMHHVAMNQHRGLGAPLPSLAGVRNVHIGPPGMAPTIGGPLPTGGMPPPQLPGNMPPLIPNPIVKDVILHAQLLAKNLSKLQSQATSFGAPGMLGPGGKPIPGMMGQIPGPDHLQASLMKHLTAAAAASAHMNVGLASAIPQPEVKKGKKRKKKKVPKELARARKRRQREQKRKFASKVNWKICAKQALKYQTEGQSELKYLGEGEKILPTLHQIPQFMSIPPILKFSCADMLTKEFCEWAAAKVTKDSPQMMILGTEVKDPYRRVETVAVHQVDREIAAVFAKLEKGVSSFFHCNPGFKWTITELFCGSEKQDVTEHWHYDLPKEDRTSKATITINIGDTPTTTLFDVGCWSEDLPVHLAKGDLLFYGGFKHADTVDNKNKKFPVRHVRLSAIVDLNGKAAQALCDMSAKDNHIR